MFLNYLMVGGVFTAAGWVLGWSMRAAWDRAIAREYLQAAAKRQEQLADLQVKFDARDAIAPKGKR